VKASTLFAAALPTVAWGPAPGEQELTGLRLDSRKIAPGDLFVALPGANTDGRDHAAAAVAAGAVAVLAEAAPPEGWNLAPWWQLPSLRPRLGALAKRLHGAPDRALELLGITGTNGKSTMVAVLAAILDRAGRPCGRLGTLGYHFRDFDLPGERTTPEAPDLYAMLAAMRDRGAAAAALEISSHALELGRVGELELRAAVLTNITRDHLDFHGDMASYAGAKEKLFGHLLPAGVAVVGLGDEWSRAIASRLANRTDLDLWTFGPGGRVQLLDARWSLSGSRLTVGIEGWPSLELETPLLGAWNAENLLAATATALGLGIEPAVIAAAAAELAPLPGRLEPIALGQPFSVLIDYAHTPEALGATLRAVRQMGGRRLLVVFGCGGDRDRGKRPVMGKIVGELADLAVATTDNPRSEDPLAILAEVEVGLRESGSRAWRKIPDRTEAIRGTIASAEPGDVVVIAGKGHETFQIVGKQRIPYSDREVARTTLEGAAWSRGR
jgi:UDP-N-acetylmuramoyl-L-alanyl-D-glutamate--2,6-diaminopimelate ligase